MTARVLSWSSEERPLMEMILAAVAGELATRSISFLIDRYSRPTATVEEKLQQTLLRVHVIVEEAEGRHITNQSMHQQLSILREAMHQGHYVLDTFRYRARGEERGNDKDHEVSYSFALSEFNPAKRICFSIGSRTSRQELQQVLDSLSNVLAYVDELVVFMKNYPMIMYRQPYDMYLFLDKCMFGRETEMEQVINFLLRTEPPSVNRLGVLPIVGPGIVGKSTLVSHVCIDERVRNHFPQIMFCREDDIQDDKHTILRDGGVVKHQNSALDNAHGRSLVIVELVGDVDEGTWRQLYSTYCSRMAPGSKILITSRSDKIVKFGTTQALTLKFLSQAAYWYFFKVLSFGSANPDEHPKLASIGMEIAKELNGCFLGANTVSWLLRANLTTHFWCKVLASRREHVQKHLALFGEGPHERAQKNRSMYLWTIPKTNKNYVVRGRFETSFADQQENPKVTMQDLLSGNVQPQGKFVALCLKSHVPPYNNYMVSAMLEKPQRLAAKKKRSEKKVT